METEKELQVSWKRKIGIICILLFSGIIFREYGYSITKITKYIILIAFGCYIAEIDKKEKRIPNKTLVYMVIVRTILLAIELVMYPVLWMEFLIHALGGLLAGTGILFLCYFLSKHSLGMGDVKFGGVIGYFTGSGIVYIIIVLSCILAAAYGLIQIARKKLTLKDEIPFGPFMQMGTVLALWIGF